MPIKPIDKAAIAGDRLRGSIIDNVNGTRLFDSHIVLDVGGMKILKI